jgi:K+-sensing histidine kinase KdpD
MRIAKNSTAGTVQGLGAALVHALDLPLSALRTSIEALSHELENASRILPHVLAEVNRLERNVQDLIEYTTPAAPLPLRCTLDEITTSAREELPSVLRNRVVQARHDQGARMVVDGPMLSRCLRRLIENALEAGSRNALVVSRRSNDGASFTVVDAAPEELKVQWAREAFHSTRANHFGLGLLLVERDVNLMGGSFTLFVTPHGTTCAQLNIPESQRPTSEETS